MRATRQWAATMIAMADVRKDAIPDVAMLAALHAKVAARIVATAGAWAIAMAVAAVAAATNEMVAMRHFHKSRFSSLTFSKWMTLRVREY